MITNFSNLSGMNSKMAHWIHDRYSNLYSYYKIQQSRVKTDIPLTASERDFYLKYQQTLQGKNLIIYDIGAAKGVVSKCLAKLPNVSIIHAFEPIPDVFVTLEDNVRNIKKVNCHNVALGNTSDYLPMYLSNKTDSSSLLKVAELHQEQFPDREFNNHIQVPVVKLDEYVYNNQIQTPDVIKIDVQGYEENVIDGGHNTISQARFCILEMSLQVLYENSPLFDDIYSLMRDLNFRLVGTSSPLKGKSGTQLQIDGIFENQTHLS